MAFDAIIIGGGHNGLVAAALLSKAGKKVLVLERRPVVGGASVTEEPFPGFRYSTCAYTSGLFQNSVATELQLHKYGYETLTYDPVAFAPGSHSSLIFWNDVEKTKEEIAGYSQKDAEMFGKFANDMGRYSGYLRLLLTSLLPNPVTASTSEFLSMAWRLRKVPRKDIVELLRILPMSVADLLNEYFEGEHLKGVLASEGLLGSFYGPRSAGSVYLMLYWKMGTGEGKKQDWPIPRGGMGALSEAIAQSARAQGAEIRTNAEVSRILIKDRKVTGVALANGEEFESTCVVSNADAKRTFLKLMDPVHLDPNFVMSVRAIKSRGVSAKVNMAIDHYPKWKNLREDIRPVTVTISPSMEYLERAFDAAKYGDFSSQPFLDVAIPSVIDSTIAPEGKHVMSVYVLFAPYHLRNGNWNDRKEELGDTVVRTIEEYAPEFSESILHRQVITPLDLETEFGLTEGNIHQGELTLDQILFMRPVPGYSRYRTPIQGLYLCGATAHPGGGVTGIPGSLAATEILADQK